MTALPASADISPTTPKPVVLLRADASTGIGIGHVMRCRSLAQALAARGAVCHFASVEILPALERLLGEEDIALHRISAGRGSGEDAAATLDLARRLDAAIIVADSYAFDGNWYATVRPVLPLLVLDDLGEVRPLPADLVWNASPNAGDIPYAEFAPGARLLLGPRYAPIRQEVTGWRRRLAGIEARLRLLVMIGGTDPLRLTLPLVRALAAIDARLTVAVGGRHPDLDALRAEQRQRPALDLRIDCFDLGPVMAEAGLAVTGGGTTTAELACLGVPAVLALVADNQLPAARHLAADGFFKVEDVRRPPATEAAERLATAASTLWRDIAKRSDMSLRLHAAYDGEGAGRVADSLLSHLRSRIGRKTDVGAFTLRPAGFGDARSLFDWRNDEETRRQSRSSAPLEWQAHLDWLRRALADPQRRILIGLAGERPCGMARLDRLDEGRSELSWVVSPEFRGRGIGARLVAAALVWADTPRVLAEIKSGNPGSLAVARRCGFRQIGDEAGITLWEAYRTRS